MGLEHGNNNSGAVINAHCGICVTHQKIEAAECGTCWMHVCVCVLVWLAESDGWMGRKRVCCHPSFPFGGNGPMNESRRRFNQRGPRHSWPQKTSTFQMFGLEKKTKLAVGGPRRNDFYSVALRAGVIVPFLRPFFPLFFFFFFPSYSAEICHVCVYLYIVPAAIMEICAAEIPGTTPGKVVGLLEWPPLSEPLPLDTLHSRLLAVLGAALSILPSTPVPPSFSFSSSLSLSLSLSLSSRRKNSGRMSIMCNICSLSPILL